MKVGPPSSSRSASALTFISGEDFYFHRNLPIKWIRAVGPIAAIDEFGSKRVFTIDDSSGKCIEAVVNIQLPSAVKGASGTLQYQCGATAGEAAKSSVLEVLNVPKPFDHFDVGDVVDVKGGLSTFRDERQIKIEKMVIVKSTAQETVLWQKRSKFRREVLNTPWVLREKDIRRCRKEAEASETRLERMRRRLKASSEDSKGAKGETSKALPTRARGGRGRPRAKEISKPKVGVAARVKELIREGSVNGKYSALGL